MARTNIPDISFEVEGDEITLWQGLNDDSVVLHRLHLAHLCAVVGLSGSAEQAATVERLSRHLMRLRDKIEDIYDLLASVPCFPPGSGETEDVTVARELLELAEMFCEDIEAKPNGNPYETQSVSSGARPALELEG